MRMHLPFLLQRAARYRVRLALISGLTLLGSLATLALPWLAGQLIGGVLESDSRPTASLAALLLLGLALTTVLNIVSSHLAKVTGARVIADIRLEIYRHVMRLPMTFHDRSRRGDLLALLTHEVTTLGHFLAGPVASLPSRLFTAAGAVAILFVIDPKLALFVPLLVPAFFIGLRLVGRHLRVLGAERRRAEASVIATAESGLEMLPAIRSFAVEAAHEATYAAAVARAEGLAERQSRIDSVVEPAIAFASATAAILVIVALGLSDTGASRDPSEVFSFLLYAALLTRPVGALGSFWGGYQTTRGTVTRMQQLLDRATDQGLERAGEGEGAAPRTDAPLPRVAGRIVFAEVTFGYEGRGPVLRDASLAVEPGQIVAITGHNGAGKTTLINLLQRFYEPQAGTIFIDGHDIATLPVHALRRQMALVPQRALLFNGTVRDNIALGRPQATEERVSGALELAQASSFVAGLPRGLDTLIGDDGVRLSGGQRQRIALARALLCDPQILIFDEATAMYDLESEAAFVAACGTALAGRTVLLVTHRPASLALAHRIVEVADGRIVERCPALADHASTTSTRP